MDTRKLIIKKLETKDFTHEDSYCEYKTWYITHTDYGGYTENDIHISLSQDGNLSCWGDSEGCYLYNKQVELLTNILIEFRNNKESK